jgi:hypothetical protein
MVYQKHRLVTNCVHIDSERALPEISWTPIGMGKIVVWLDNESKRVGTSMSKGNIIRTPNTSQDEDY